MLKGHNLIGFDERRSGTAFLQSYNPAAQVKLPVHFVAATNNEINEAVTKATNAFILYKDLPSEERAVFLETIAEEIMALGDELIQTAMQETGLTEARLTGERARTTSQLKLFAELLREGSWVEAVIDKAMPDRKPLPRADIRKMLVPIGPVLVFGASNFPFAFSTAGGDTASALAAGNPVIVKAHESHLGTNELVASAIINAAKKCNMPDGIFSSITGEGAVAGMQLVKHPGIKAVGFTGSFKAGMAIYKAAVNDRETPIPVYAEMSSINPVLILPEKLKQDADTVAAQLAGSITLGAGQFCTNPGLLFLLEDSSSANFIKKLSELVSAVAAATMLNANVCKNYYNGVKNISGQKGVKLLLNGKEEVSSGKSAAVLLQVGGEDFITNAALQNEMFGPASLVILCRDKQELSAALNALHGQLTATIFGLSSDIESFAEAIASLSGKVGRVVYNGVPTGVEVGHAMMHGGPFPATTDFHFTSVGADAIKRFARPLCLQDCPAEFLPAALKDNNPLNIMRKINGEYSRDKW